MMSLGQKYVAKSFQQFPLCCRTPTRIFSPASKGDRPDVVPEGSTNLGFTGQYCEIPGDIVFTEEYSVRAARTAVYKLLGMSKEVAPIKPIHYDVRILLAVLDAYLK
jgi:oleate hydratase